MPYFSYGHTETAHLSKRCKKMAALIERLGPIEREVDGNLFSSLVNSIIAQQISTKAAVTVSARLYGKIGALTPEGILALPVEELQACGMSMRKASYISEMASAVQSGALSIDELRDAPDDEVIRLLSTLKGIGVWTAEMLLIFSLQRADVVSYLDLGIRKGMMALYGKKQLTQEQFMKYRQRYTPYGSVASLYLWALAGELPNKKPPS